MQHSGSANHNGDEAYNTETMHTRDIVATRHTLRVHFSPKSKQTFMCLASGWWQKFESAELQCGYESLTTHSVHIHILCHKD